MIRHHFFLLFLVFLQIHSLAQSSIQKTKYKGEEVFVYPYRIPLNTSTSSVPPYFGNLPDGKYIAYYSYLYYYKFSLLKMGQKEKTTDSLIVACEFELKNNKKNGVWKNYSSKKYLRESGVYAEDRKDGTWIRYRIIKKKPNISSKTDYVNGKKHGKFTDYYSNGNINNEYVYKNDVRFGEEKRFYKNGTLFYKTTLCDSVYYISNFFSDTKQSNVLTEADPLLNQSYFNSSLKFSSNRLESNKKIHGFHGPITLFYSNGKKVCTLLYNSGNLMWVDTIWGNDGRIIATYQKENPTLSHNETTVTITYYTKKNEKRNIKKYFNNGSVEVIRFYKSDTVYTRTNVYNYTSDTLQLISETKRKDYSYKEYYHAPSKTKLEHRIKIDNSNYFKDLNFDKKSGRFTWTEVDSSHNGNCKIETYRFKVLNENNNLSEKNLVFESYFTTRLFINGQPAQGKFIVQAKSKKNELYSIKKSGETTILVYGNYQTHYGDFKNGYMDGNWIHKKDNRIIEQAHFEQGMFNGTVIHYSQKTNLSKEEKRLAADCGLKGKKINYISSIKSFENNKKDGDFVVFDYLGNIQSFKQYRKNKLNGRLEIYEDDSRLNESASYRDGLANGPYLIIDYKSNYIKNKLKRKPKYIVERYRDRTIKTNFINGEIDGDFEVYQQDVTMVKGQLKNGHPVGVWNFYAAHPEIPFFTVDFSADNSFKLKLRGASVAEEDISKFEYVSPQYDFLGYENKKQLRNGFITTYYPNGDTCFYGKFGSSGPEGEWWIMAENRDKIKRFDFFNDRMVYHNDTIQTSGLVTTFHPNKQKHVEAIILRYNFTFDCVSLHSVPTAEIVHKNIWDENGKQILKDGTGKVYEKNEKGLLIAEGELINYNREGLWKYYNESGSLIEIGMFVNGKKDGKWLRGDLSGLNLDGLNCFDLNDPNLQSQIEYQKKMVFLKETIYEMGKIIHENSFNLNLNKQYKY